MPGGELEPITRSAPVLSDVAAEMSEIFDRAGVGQPAPGLRRPAAVAALRPSQNSSPVVTVLIAAVAGLAGLGAGAFVIHMPSAAIQAPAKVAIRAGPQAQSQPQSSPQEPPRVALAQAAPAPAVPTTPAAQPPAAQSPSAQSPSAKSAPEPAATPAARRARFRVKLAKLGEAKPASAKPPLRLREPTPPMAQPASCEQDVEGDGCRRAVVDADRHLRAVYENAIRRGVSRSTLVDYRDRWADLRDRQTDSPTRLIQSYGALAYDLGRESASQEDEDDSPRPRSRSGLKALADLLLPWR